MGKESISKLKSMALSIIAIILIFLFYDGETNKFKFFLCVVGMVILLVLINLELWKALNNRKGKEKDSQ